MPTTIRGRRRHPQQQTAVVRKHLTSLLSAGMTRRAITAEAGVADRTLYAIINHTTPHVRGGTAAALLAVQPRPAAENGLVPALGTIRRLQALIAYGYPVEHLAAHTGLAVRGLWKLIGPGQQTVEITTRNRVAGAYEHLSTMPGPSEAARDTGRTRGWAAPAAWDDIDNPAEEPNPGVGQDDTVDEVLVRRAIHAPALAAGMNDAERVELARQWRQYRLNHDEPYGYKPFAATFGIKEFHAQQIMRAANQAAPQPHPAAAESRTNRKAA